MQEEGHIYKEQAFDGPELKQCGRGTTEKRERTEHEDVTEVSKIPNSQRNSTHCGIVKHDLPREERPGIASEYSHVYTVSSW